LPRYRSQWHNCINVFIKLSVTYPIFNNLLTVNKRFSYICAGVSLLRPAPLELPQGGNAARVESCSGAIKVAYPFYF